MELVFFFVLLLAGISTVAWFSKPKTEVKAPEQEVDTTPPVKGGANTAKVTRAVLAKMTKVEIEKHARANGIELDRRKTKANMIDAYLIKLK